MEKEKELNEDLTLRLSKSIGVASRELPVDTIPSLKPMAARSAGQAAADEVPTP
jgi:hypothetical protein